MKLPISYIPKRVSILGAARSGCAAAQFMVHKGISVFISDSCSADKLDAILAQSGLSGVPHESGGHSPKVLDAEVIVCSPGVASNAPILLEAGKRSIAIWSEIELAFRFSKSPYIAVTGSSGKSTTVSLIGSIIEAAHIPGVVAGNIGLPLISVAPSLGADALVIAEVSSFQLETIDSFKPRVAVVLNFMKNHLDRYESEDAYYDAKKKIADNLTKTESLVLNAKDDRLRAWGERLKDTTTVAYFNGNVSGHKCVWREGSVIRARFGGEEKALLDVSGMKIGGDHNYQNACAAAAAALAAGIDDASIAKGISSFTGLEHRLEFVAEVGGVRYFNDSKSTTAESVVCAVSAFDDNVYLIAGGRDKGCDFSIVKTPIARHVKGVCLIGEAADRMQAEWSASAPVFRAATLSEAVHCVREKAVAGDVVVFSPGCSSFDMFRNYEHRGAAFKKLVGDLA